MSLVICSHCRNRVNIPHSERKFLDQSGDFVCSSTCMYGWAKKNQRKQKRNLLKHPGIFKSEMSGGFEVYSKILRMGFRSGYEQIVAEWLYENDIAFEYEPFTFLLDTDTASYTPDFYLPDFQVLIEVKGLWMRRNKVQKFRELYSIPLIVASWNIRKSFNYKNTGGKYGGSF